MIDLTAAVTPAVGPAQRASMLFGSLEVPAQPIAGAAPAGQLRFLVTSPGPASYRVRLRVDGVDSPLVDLSNKPPVFLAPVVEVTS